MEVQVFVAILTHVFLVITVNIEATVHHDTYIEEVLALARLHHLCKAAHIISHFNFEDK